MTGRLTRKRALVIGAGSVSDGIGNGRASAMLFAREGACVLVMDRDGAAAADTVARIRADGGVAEQIIADATDAQAMNRVMNTAQSLWGGLDIVQHTVGMSMAGGVTDTSPDDWDTVFTVNLKSAFLAARAAVPIMKSGGGGAFVFISSLAAHQAGPYSYAAYEASKAGVNRLARSIARAHAGDNIRANVVMPGIIDTPHVQAFITDAQASADRAKLVPLGRQGSPWDVAEAALFLASDAAGFITGAVLPVDGGMSA